MMTKVKMSFHETIIIILSDRLESDESMSPDCPVKYIILSRCPPQLVTGVRFAGAGG